MINSIYVGYDKNQEIATEVCCYSIKKHLSRSIDVFQLKRDELIKNGIYTRGKIQGETTEFGYTRFLIPNLMQYEGWGLFCDADFLFVDDISKIIKTYDQQKAVYVVKHQHTPTNTIKMVDKIQDSYQRKNWSSLIIFNNSHIKNKTLTPHCISNESKQFLNEFQWLYDDDIGEIELSWNFLVGINKHSNPRGFHYTDGGPWLEGMKNVPYSEIWNSYYLESLKKNKV